MEASLLQETKKEGMNTPFIDGFEATKVKLKSKENDTGSKLQVSEFFLTPRDGAEG